MPGIETTLVITPKRTGDFPVICTELCGPGHPIMRARVIVMAEQEYEAWLEESGGTTAEATDGEAIFQEAGCGGCHAFEPAGASAEIGPPLDDLPDDPELVRQAIVDPDAEIASGFEAGVMPDTFGEQLSGEQLDALVQYLLGGTS